MRVFWFWWAIAQLGGAWSFHALSSRSRLVGTAGRLGLSMTAGTGVSGGKQPTGWHPAAAAVVSKVKDLRGEARRRMQSRLDGCVAWMCSSWKQGKLHVATALLLLTITFGRAAGASAASGRAASAAPAAVVCASPGRASSASTSSSSTAAASTVVELVINKQQATAASQPATASTSTHYGSRLVAATRLGKSIKAIDKDPGAFVKARTNEITRWGWEVEREIERDIKDVEDEVGKTFESLFSSLQGAKLDTLILLIVTSAVIPIFKAYNVSSILGFLFFGTVLGPNGLNWLKDVHMIDVLGELGIVFFLFEIGLELSLERLMAMKKDVFGLGTSQFIVTSALGTLIGRLCGLPTAAAVTIGGSLSLSSSAFVLQLLKDKKAMGSRVGRASFGILLLQDLAVVPLLVVVELLAKGGSGLAKALGIAFIKALVALSSMSFAGRKVLAPIFFQVAKSGSQEAFLSIILSTVLLMSFITQGIGLSNTLGAFLAGLLLAETKYRYQVESDIAPFRGLLLGFFFITVGFSIDPRLLLTSAPQILLLLLVLLGSKAAIITGLSMANGLSFSDAQQTGILNAQGGEFAFVAFAIAEKSALISPRLNKILLTTVALSMALTPALAELGAGISARLEEGRGQDVSRLLGHDDEGAKLKGEMLSKDNLVLVIGYGRVGRMVCDMLDRQLIPYMAVDSRPQKAMDARAKGLPVFFGDVNRPEVLNSFHLESAKACVITIDDLTAINKAVVSVRKMFPGLPIVARAANAQHQKRLEGTFDNVYAMCPMLPEDSVLLTLPFGGAVLQQIGVSRPEIDAILEDFRDMYMDPGTEDQMDFFTSFQKRLPPSNPDVEGSEEEAGDKGELVINPVVVAEETGAESVLVDVLGGAGAGNGAGDGAGAGAGAGAEGGEGSLVEK